MLLRNCSNSVKSGIFQKFEFLNVNILGTMEFRDIYTVSYMINSKQTYLSIEILQRHQRILYTRECVTR